LIRAFNDTDPFEKLGHSRLTTDDKRLATRDSPLTTPPPAVPEPSTGTPRIPHCVRNDDVLSGWLSSRVPGGIFSKLTEAVPGPSFLPHNE
jgi:hypothetical protein